MCVNLFIVSNMEFHDYVMLVDDFSWYFWIFPLLRKLDVFHNIGVLKITIEIILEIKIKNFLVWQWN